jgi:hypothetical protein
MAGGAMKARPLLFVFCVAGLLAWTPACAEIDLANLTPRLENTDAPVQDAPAAIAPEPMAPPRLTLKPTLRRGNPLWAIPLRALSATRERPLFSVSRRPPPLAIPAASTPAPPPMPVAIRTPEPERPPLALVGTIVGADKRFAIFFNQTTRIVTRVQEGAQENGWLVKAVSLRSAILEKGARSVTLDLPRPGTAASAIEAPAQTPPQQPSD